MKIRDLFNTVHRLSMNRSGVNTKLAYAVKKNLRLLRAELKDANEVLQQVPEDLQEYDKARLELCKEHCDHDEKGEPVTDDRGFVFTDPAAFAEIMKPLQEQYADALQAREDEIEALLDTEVQIEFHKIKVDDLPDNLNENDIESLMDILWED